MWAQVWMVSKMVPEMGSNVGPDMDPKSDFKYYEPKVGPISRIQMWVWAHKKKMWTLQEPPRCFGKETKVKAQPAKTIVKAFPVAALKKQI